MSERGDSSVGASADLLAPAKINLNLLVGAAREDGFHPLDSIVTTVSLCDAIELSTSGGDGFELNCAGFDCGPSEKNLAMRAAVALGRLAGRSGVCINLSKRIPPGMGLGGGSSDAAAVLRGLCDLWELDVADTAVAALAAELGSDVPLFLGSSAQRMTGRGECLRPMMVHPFTVVLILPPFGCSTAAVYKAYDESPRGIGPQLDADLIASRPPSIWREQLVNDLAGPARSVCPPLAALQDRLTEALSSPVHITGSGSGMFVLCDDMAEARTAVKNIEAALTPDDKAQTVIVEPL